MVGRRQFYFARQQKCKDGHCAQLTKNTCVTSILRVRSRQKNTRESASRRIFKEFPTQLSVTTVFSIQSVVCLPTFVKRHDSSCSMFLLEELTGARATWIGARLPWL